MIVAAVQICGPAQSTVASDPVDIYYDYLFERGGLDLGRKAEQVGVFDLGYRDAGVAWFSAGRYAGGESVPGGMAESLREVKRLIAATYCQGRFTFDPDRRVAFDPPRRVRSRSRADVVGWADDQISWRGRVSFSPSFF